MIINIYVCTYRDTGVRTFECIFMYALVYMHEFIEIYKYIHEVQYSIVIIVSRPGTGNSCTLFATDFFSESRLRSNPYPQQLVEAVWRHLQCTNSQHLTVKMIITNDLIIFNDHAILIVREIHHRSAPSPDNTTF